ncbi:protein-disulfide reductase DsbD family protein [Endozoicomonas sp. Mp262]|uniref:protein-disulfide reductase DsbD family protein n=1 Tax=Endozoicomonas sp. Mp262 TaxID=2919499 RepID=UPI0021D93D2C
MRKPTYSIAALLLFVSTLLTALSPLNARAESHSTGWMVNPDHPPVSVRFMLTGQVEPITKTVEGVLEIKLEQDWKTYWHTPGEGGIAPTLDWSPSENLNKVDWHWPVPHRYQVMGVETMGYKGHVLFPMTLHLEDIGQLVRLNGTLTLSSCTTICVLTDYQIQLNFAPEQLQPIPEAMHLYNQGISTLPKSVSPIKLEQALWSQNQETVLLKLDNPNGWQTPDIFVDAGDGDLSDTTFHRPHITIDGNLLTATLKASSWLEAPQLENKTLSLVISDQNLAAKLSAPLTTGVTEQKATIHLLIAIGIALLGGLILNIMPCVLPVLGMKLSTVISAKGLEKRQIRSQFLASAAGILTSFWLLAGFLAVLKLSGQTLGWGVQFQNPYFIGVMVLITGLFAANMLGLFEIQLPSSISTWLATKGDHHSTVGHFIQGMFATLLATPCSAPFLGTAVAFALGADLITLWITFTALAIGMAAPWLLVAAFPGLANLLPKPGGWMNGIKWLFGLMMLASSLWLLSLMTGFLGLPVTAIIAAAGLSLLLWRLWLIKGPRSVILVLATLSLSIAAILLASFITGKSASPLPPELKWQSLNRALIRQSVDQGKTVFVDVTADWCITCKANKAGVILQEPVYSKLQESNMVRMQGDWTKPSETVTAFLQAHGRFGVPFNIVYGPGAPEGIPLPVILTKDAVIEAINNASN